MPFGSVIVSSKFSIKCCYVLKPHCSFGAFWSASFAKRVITKLFMAVTSHVGNLPRHRKTDQVVLSVTPIWVPLLE